MKRGKGGAHTTKEEAFPSDHGVRRDKAANSGQGKAHTALDLLCTYSLQYAKKLHPQNSMAITRLKSRGVVF